MNREKLDPPKNLRLADYESCATCKTLELTDSENLNTRKQSCKRPGGPIWKDRRAIGHPKRYVCDFWEKK